MEKRNWTELEDHLLRHLRETRQIKNWTEVSRLLSEEYQIKGVSCKDCRQRYAERFNQKDCDANWTFSDQKTLFSLHNEIGNKWAVISRRMPGRSDNCIKNHFYSRLRKGLRKLNSAALSKLGPSFRQIKFTVLFKIVEANEESFKDNLFCEQDTSRQCYVLKNKLITLSYDENEENDFEPLDLSELELYEEINRFSRNYKRKPKKYRRVPVRPQELKKCEDQSFGIVEKVRQSTNAQQNPSVEYQIESSTAQNEVVPESPFKEFEQEQIGAQCEIRTLRNRKVSVETAAIPQELALHVLQDLNEFPSMPLLSKKRTSFYDFGEPEEPKQNMFLQDCEFDNQSMMMRGLLSMKRLSHTDEALFD